MKTYVQETKTREESGASPKCGCRQFCPGLRKHPDRSSAKAVEHYEAEQEKYRRQAAWVMRCVKVRFEPFPNIDRVYVANGRIWHRDAAPAYLDFGLDEFLSYLISQLWHSNKLSEEHKTAKIALRMLLKK